MLITPQQLKSWLNDGQEIALLDVREHGQYGENHLFYVVSVPYSNLEHETVRLVPKLTTRIVVVDEDGQALAQLATKRLSIMGYSNIHILEGGTQGWKLAGYELFAGVNLPSKTFGELAEHAFNTPRISAIELDKRIAEGDKLLVLDGRPFTEYKKMSIPTAVCCPNGELPLRIDDLVSDLDTETTVVINCAGRTRSIIGAQTLINLGIKQRVLALENGTQGWYLADLLLDHGQTRRHGLEIDPSKLATRRARARNLAQKHGVKFVDASTVQAWLDDPQRTTYLCDVRTPEEFAQASLQGAQHTPGGQLVQATDQFIGTRGARLVLFDSEEVRAPAMASWMAMMGWEVAVLEKALAATVNPAKPAQRLPSALPTLTAVQAKEKINAGALLLDLRSSTAYKASHIEDAVWAIRPRLTKILTTNSALTGLPAVVLVTDTPATANAAALDLRETGITDIGLLKFQANDLINAGFRLTASPQTPPDPDCIDYLFFVHDRHDGNKQAAQQYLDWETNLLSQIDEQERNSYRLPH